jgi:ankyrin repeat protein
VAAALLTLASCAPAAVPSQLELSARDAAGRTVMHRAARDGRTRELAACLDAGADREQPVDQGRTPLHWAAIGGSTSTVELLLARGARVDARAHYDMTPLHWAALAGHAKVAALLLTRGAALSARNLFGMTPLHLAGDPKVVRALVEAGAAVEATDMFGMTPLHWAWTEGAAQALIDAGANAFARARDGRQPVRMSVAGNEQLALALAYPEQDRVRLRGPQATLGVVLRSVAAESIALVRLEAGHPALDVKVTPPSIARLDPAQLARFEITVSRRAGAEVEVGALPVRFVDGAGRVLAALELKVDARTFETPEDRGLVQVTGVTVRPAPAWWQYLGYAAAPVVLVAAWVVIKARRGGRAER